MSQPELSLITTIADTGGSKGRGTFAAEDITAGALIFSEKPLLAADTTSATCHADLIATFTELPEERQDLILDMNANDPSAFRHLVWAELDTEGGWWFVNRKYGENAKHILTAFNTNAVCQHLGLRTAMLSHSCSPNAYAAFEEGTEELTVHALREIKQGEEVCISYLEGAALFESMKLRRGMLVLQRGFICICKACMDAEDCEAVKQECAEEKLRADLCGHIHQYRVSEATLTKKPKASQLGSIKTESAAKLGRRVADIVVIIEKSGLTTVDTLEWYRHGLRWSMAQHDKHMVREWREKMLDVVRLSVGQSSAAYIELQQETNEATIVGWENLADTSPIVPSNTAAPEEKKMDEEEAAEQNDGVSDLADNQESQP